MLLGLYRGSCGRDHIESWLKAILFGRDHTESSLRSILHFLYVVVTINGCGHDHGFFTT